ncbi:ACT domain-containing protein [Alteromonadaceae bacterium BrNp21-10]|nr:ACT domain-containing protein [Alteromonadaceae bacterium BrNp21-10]
MTGISDLALLLASCSPVLSDKCYVFCCVTENHQQWIERCTPLVTINEDEGMTLIVEADMADQVKLNYNGKFKKITLTVHSSLEAVGLTAAFSKALAQNNISANVIAGFYHDHIFVTEQDADKAMATLIRLQQQHQQQQ